MPKLTKRIVDGAEPKEKDYFLWDEEIPGFGLRVMPSGRKTYVLQYRTGGRTRRVSITTHGAATPDEARKKAHELLVKILNGGNPSEDKRLQRESPRVRDLGERFFSEHAAINCKRSTQLEYRRNLDLFIFPKIGAFRVADVTRTDIANLHQSLSHIPYQANRMLGVISVMFNHAELWGWRADGSNPCRHVKKYKELRRERYLTAEEMQRLGQVLTQMERDGLESIYAIAAYRLLMLTGCRLGEIQLLKWEYVRGDYLHLPDSKTGAKKVLLAPAAMAVLQSIPRIEGNPYVIAAEKTNKWLNDLQHPWQRVRDMANLPNLRIHDLRHNYASVSVNMGESLPIIGKMLGHTQVQTTARYAHLADAPVRLAATKVSSEIANLLGILQYPKEEIFLQGE